MPIILGFAKTSYKTGKNLLSLAKFVGGDMFSRQYKLSTKLVNGKEGEYFVLEVAAAGMVSNEMYHAAEGMWNDYAARRDSVKADDGEFGGEQ